MSNSPQDRRYSKDHEWVRDDHDGTVTIGITDFAQKQLGDVVFIELAKVGDQFESGDPFGSVESVKAVTEVFFPMAGKILKVNEALDGSPETANEDPYGEGWMIAIQPTDMKTYDDLLTAAEYDDYVKQEE